MTASIIGGPIVVLIFTLDVVGLAFYLKRSRCPSPRTWCVRFVHGVETLRSACYMLFLLLAWAAFLLLLPLLPGWGDRHATALWGSLDLLSAVALYGLWQWAGQLIRRAILSYGKIG